VGLAFVGRVDVLQTDRLNFTAGSDGTDYSPGFRLAVQRVSELHHSPGAHPDVTAVYGGVPVAYGGNEGDHVLDHRIAVTFVQV
jgi:hypothetical protein